LSSSAVPAWLAPCGSNQELIEMTWVVAFGLTDFAPIWKAFTLPKTEGTGNDAT
jgi:hypothetical protein